MASTNNENVSNIISETGDNSTTENAIIQIKSFFKLIFVKWTQTKVIDIYTNPDLAMFAVILNNFANSDKNYI